MIYPNHFCLVSGSGKDKIKLLSFDKALFDAGVANYNHLKVSSILPKGCLHEKKITAAPGSIVYSAFATKSYNQVGSISSAVAVGVPKSDKDIGVIMEYSCNGSKENTESMVREMVERAMRLRSIEIETIKITSIETNAEEGVFTTVFSGLVMWLG
jgi:arginine decarboxylase